MDQEFPVNTTDYIPFLLYSSVINTVFFPFLCKGTYYINVAEVMHLVYEKYENLCLANDLLTSITLNGSYILL